MTMRRLALVVLACLALIAPAGAVQPDEVLRDPALEARARALSKELRCMVCQNESLDESNAPLARDLRLLVRERLTQGSSDREVLDFLVARYGDFVLLRPRFGTGTLLLWGAPVIALGIGAAVLVVAWRRRRAAPDEASDGADNALTAEERARLERLVATLPRVNETDRRPQGGAS